MCTRLLQVIPAALYRAWGGAGTRLLWITKSVLSCGPEWDVCQAALGCPRSTVPGPGWSGCWVALSQTERMVLGSGVGLWSPWFGLTVGVLECRILGHWVLVGRYRRSLWWVLTADIWEPTGRYCTTHCQGHGNDPTQVMAGKRLPSRVWGHVQGQSVCWCGSSPGLHYSPLQDGVGSSPKPLLAWECLQW